MTTLQKILVITAFSITILLLSFSHTNGSKNTNHSNKRNKSAKTLDSETELLSGSNYKVLNVISKKDKIFYTQGIFLEGEDYIVESGGMYGMSTLTRMKYPSLEIVKQAKLKDSYFAEGIAKVGNNIYQLTWRENKILKYNSETFEVEELVMDSKMREGWGLANYKNNELIATDGSDKIFFLDDKTLASKRVLQVTYDGMGVNLLNALAYDGKYIYANIYYSTTIVKIDQNDGNVVERYEMSKLVDHEINKNTLTRTRLNSGEVLNGICYNEKSKLFIVTGKRWGHLFEVEFK